MAKLNDRNRKKLAKSTLKLLHPGTQLHDLAVGRGSARMTTSGIVILAVVAGVVLLGLAMGTIIIPGWIPIVLLYGEIMPKRVVAVVDGGLVILGCSIWSGKPSGVVCVLPPAPVHGGGPSGPVTIALGAEQVKFTRFEYDRLVAATAWAGTPPTANPTGWSNVAGSGASAPGRPEPTGAPAPFGNPYLDRP